MWSILYAGAVTKTMTPRFSRPKSFITYFYIFIRWWEKRKSHFSWLMARARMHTPSLTHIVHSWIVVGTCICQPDAENYSSRSCFCCRRFTGIVVIESFAAGNENDGLKIGDRMYMLDILLCFFFLPLASLLSCIPAAASKLLAYAIVCTRIQNAHTFLLLHIEINDGNSLSYTYNLWPPNTFCVINLWWLFVCSVVCIFCCCIVCPTNII